MMITNIYFYTQFQFVAVEISYEIENRDSGPD